MFVHMGVNGYQISTIVKTGATHSLVAEKIVITLGLSVVRHLSCIKVVNFEAQVMWGMAYGVKVFIGNWDGKMDLMVVPLDDFNLILGNDFFVVAKVAMAILLHLFGLLIVDEKKPCFIARHCIPFDVEVREQKVEVVSVMQVARGRKKGRRTLLFSSTWA